MTEHRTLRYRFSLEKLVNSLAHFAAKGVHDLTKLKAAKLLYLADREHLYAHGRPITGDRYLAMELGPVPEDAFQLIGRLIQPLEVDYEGHAYASRFLGVHRGWFGKYPALRARRQPDLSVFSDSEIAVLDSVLAEHGNKTARELVDLTHEHRAYQLADRTRAKGSSEQLPYDLFFEDAPSGVRERAQSLAQRHQEAYDFAASLRAAGKRAVEELGQIPVAACRRS